MVAGVEGSETPPELSEGGVREGLEEAVRERVSRGSLEGSERASRALQRVKKRN